MNPIQEAFASLTTRQQHTLAKADQQRIIFTTWLVLTLLAGFAVAIAFHHLISRRVMRPLLGMAARTKQFTLGRGENRLVLRYNDEFGALAKAFNTLMQRIENNMSLLQTTANTDPLTGLANRRYFEAVLLEESQRMQRSQQPMSLIMLDVDNFKAYNDLYGHPEGDECLRQLAQTLKACLQRPSDRIARFGGEEFVCLLPETDLEQARHVTDCMLDRVRALALPHQGNIVPIVTISLGVSACNGDTATPPAALLQRADELLYQAKHSGRNCACFDRPPEQPQSLHAL
nr:sensor domain-containing diguanylate cyclase [Atopomonas sediminilitoris]